MNCLVLDESLVNLITSCTKLELGLEIFDKERLKTRKSSNCLFSIFFIRVFLLKIPNHIQKGGYNSKAQALAVFTLPQRFHYYLSFSPKVPPSPSTHQHLSHNTEAVLNVQSMQLNLDTFLDQVVHSKSVTLQ